MCCSSSKSSKFKEEEEEEEEDEDEEDEEEEEEKFPFLGGEEEKILSFFFVGGGKTPLPFDDFEQKTIDKKKKKNWKIHPDKALRYGAPSRERLARVVVFAIDDDDDDDASKGWCRAKTRSSASRHPGTTKL